MPRPNFLNFLGDFGDVVGGMTVMDALHRQSPIELGIGIGLILGCIYLKFYHRK